MARRLVGLTVGDRPDAWRALGFDVTGDRLTVGGVTVHLVGDDGARGILAWSLDPPPDADDLDGLAHRAAPAPVAGGAHVNGVTAVDHVVAGTPHVRRTLGALATVGLEPRRVAEGLQGDDRAYAFVLLVSCVLEVIGPAHHDPGRTPAPAAFVGLAFVASDLGPVSALDGVAGTPRPAVQPGREIVTLRTRDHDVSVPVAVLTPRPGR